jgi:hypothetical protein
MIRPFRFGAGGRLGSGRQWMSWIALEDVIDIIRSSISDSEMSGAVNVVAPNPVQNSDFAHLVGRILHRPSLLPAPPFMLRLALGEMADALLLASQRAVPERLLQSGQPFKFAEIEPALRAMLSAAS